MYNTIVALKNPITGSMAGRASAGMPKPIGGSNLRNTQFTIVMITTRVMIPDAVAAVVNIVSRRLLRCPLNF